MCIFTVAAFIANIVIVALIFQLALNYYLLEI